MLTMEALRQSPQPTSMSAATLTGIKRKNEDDIASEQRLAKRFHLLSLGKSKHDITAEDIQRIHLQLKENESKDEQYDLPEAPRLRRSRSNAFSDAMNVDDSRHRVFIHNLEEELAELSSDGEYPIFIPDIERRLNMLPKTLLRPDDPPRQGNELVLYGIPTSLSVPMEMDGARKAIIESRQRAHDKVMQNNSSAVNVQQSSEILNSRGSSRHQHEDDDIMDIS